MEIETLNLEPHYYSWQLEMRNLLEQHHLYITPTQINGPQIKAGVSYKDYKGEMRNLYSIQTGLMLSEIPGGKLIEYINRIGTKEEKPFLMVESDDDRIKWLQPQPEISCILYAYTITEIRAHQLQDYSQLSIKFGMHLKQALTIEKIKEEQAIIDPFSL